MWIAAFALKQKNSASDGWYPTIFHAATTFIYEYAHFLPFFGSLFWFSRKSPAINYEWMRYFFFHFHSIFSARSTIWDFCKLANELFGISFCVLSLEGKGNQIRATEISISHWATYKSLFALMGKKLYCENIHEKQRVKHTFVITSCSCFNCHSLACET